MIRLSIFALLGALLVAVPAPRPAAAQGIVLADSFDAGRLSRSEVGFVQAALAFEGSYDGLLDGLWGAGSQAALQSYVDRARGGGTPDYDDLRALVRDFDGERRSGGWAPVYHADSQVGHLLPMTRLTRSDTPEETRYATEDGGLVVVARASFAWPGDLHQAIEDDARAGTVPYRTETDSRIITAARMRGGRQAYVRSDRDAVGWDTHILIADAAHEDDLQLIASSFQRGPVAELAVPQEGVLGALLRSDPLPGTDRPSGTSTDETPSLESLIVGVLGRVLVDALEDDDARSEAARQDPELAEPEETDEDSPGPARRRAASGFFVNTTDIVTSSEVVAACGDVALVDGTPLKILARDDDAGIAVVASPGRSRNWLAVATADSDANRAVRLLFRSGRDGKTAAARDGQVTGSASDGRMRHDVRIAPRADGAPLLASDGRVLGVALSEEAGGTALAASSLRGRLDRIGVPYSDGDRRQTGLTDQTPQTLTAAVVPIRCADR